MVQQNSHNNFRSTFVLEIQLNLPKPICTGRGILRWTRQGVGLHSVKHIENDQKPI